MGWFQGAASVAAYSLRNTTIVKSLKSNWNLGFTTKRKDLRKTWYEAELGSQNRYTDRTILALEHEVRD